MKYCDIRKILAPYAHGPLLIGFSGGADSLAALLTVWNGAPELRPVLTAVHFDHGLRGAESRADAEFCRAFCEARQIPFRMIPLQIPPGDSIESAARRCRLDAWHTLAPAAIIVGHHADDRKENLLLRLLRGSNVSGLTGLRRCSQVENLTFLRPLYDFSRAEIEALLHQNGITQWCVDRTNLESDYRRNYLRNQILPRLRKIFPAADAGLMRSLEALECDAAYLEELAAQKYAENHIDDAGWWRDCPAALRPRVLRLLLSTVPTRGFLSNFEQWLADADGSEPRELALPDGQVWVSRNGRLAFRLPCPQTVEFRPADATEAAFSNRRFRCAIQAKMPPIADAATACFDADLLPERLILSPPGDGEAMIPFGKTDPVALKKLRNRVSVAAAAGYPVLKTPDGRILWYPGVRHGAHCPVTPQTKRVLVVSMIENH